MLLDLCEPEDSTVFVHDRGHEVPGVGDKRFTWGGQVREVRGGESRGEATRAQGDGLGRDLVDLT